MNTYLGDIDQFFNAGSEMSALGAGMCRPVLVEGAEGVPGTPDGSIFFFARLDQALTQTCRTR